MTIREMTADDLERAREINELNLSDVTPVSVDELGRILADSRVALVAVEPEGTVVGFSIIIDSTCGQLTDRSAWALQTSGKGLHIDRVIFDLKFSGLGLGRLLYDEIDRRVEQIAASNDSGTTTLTSLVRIEPPNPHSVGYHEKRGYVNIAEAMFDEQKFALTRLSVSA